MSGRLAADMHAHHARARSRCGAQARTFGTGTRGTPEPLDAAVSDVVKSRTLRSNGSCTRAPSTAAVSLGQPRAAPPHAPRAARGGHKCCCAAGGSVYACVRVRAWALRRHSRSSCVCVRTPLPEHAPAPPVPRQHPRRRAGAARCRRHPGSCPRAGAAARPTGDTRSAADPAPAPHPAPSRARARAPTAPGGCAPASRSHVRGTRVRGLCELCLLTGGADISPHKGSHFVSVHCRSRLGAKIRKTMPPVGRQ